MLAKLDRTHHIINTTYVGIDGVPQRIEIDYVDRTEDTFLDIMIKKRSQNAIDYKIIGSEDSGTHLFSDNYVKALHDKGYVSDEKDGLIAGKKGYRSLINQEKDTSKPAKYFGDDA